MSRASSRVLVAIGLAIGLSVVPLARAEDVTPTLHAEGTAQTMLTSAYRDRFDWGGGGTVRAGLEVVGPLAIQLGFGTAWYPVTGQEAGNLYSLELGARGFFRVDPVLGGPFVDANAGVGFTGPLVRFLFDVGVGWDFFPVPALGIGPVVRYQQIVQPDGEPLADDAYIFAFGLNVTVRIETVRAEPVVIEREVPVVAAPADADADGVDDADDRCVDVAEDTDGHEDADGCPDADNDSDGFDDAADRCPDAPEARNGYDDEDGCPDEPPVTVAPAPGSLEELPQVVLFRVGTDRVSPRFRSVIESVCALMIERPDVRIRVVGHADEQGTAAGNQRLGAARAGAVAEQLVLCGADPSRIESTSYGDTQPECAEGGDECHERNRRAGFVILEPGR
jgi:outer membrane protein OmpA-like peptidoglycan-associated protein